VASIESLVEQIADFKEQIAAYEKQTVAYEKQTVARLEKVALLEQENLKLRAMLDKNSSNSSTGSP
jgi:regulator of replication initiation timing